MSSVQQVSHTPVLNSSPVSNEGDTVDSKEDTLSCFVVMNCTPKCISQGDVIFCMSGRNCRPISLCNTDPPEKKKRVVDQYLAILRRPVKLDEEDYSDTEKKVETIRAFGNMGKKGAVAIPELMTFLKSPNARLRGATATALGNLGVLEALPQIMTLAKEDPYPYVKEVALEAVLSLTKKPSP